MTAALLTLQLACARSAARVATTARASGAQRALALVRGASTRARAPRLVTGCLDDATDDTATDDWRAEVGDSVPTRVCPRCARRDAPP